MDINKKDASWTEIFSNADNGVYYPEMPNKKRILIIIAYVLLFAGCVAAFLVGAILFSSSALQWYVIVLEAVSVYFMIRIISALITYVFAPRPMSYADYNKSSFALEKASLWCAICLAGAAVATVIHIFLDSSDMKKDIIAAILFLAAAALSAVITMIERKIEYTRISQEKQDY